ncbi:L,D-transpeptidase family protein [Vibrio mediterranei]|uniref:L,D-transpeptidase family protein n=1 Tax=Vibrio mediterranei TaxID=689 RepID=UPI0040694479
MRNWLLSLLLGFVTLSFSSIGGAAPDQVVVNSSDLQSYSVKHIEPVLKNKNAAQVQQDVDVSAVRADDDLLYPSLVEYLYSRLSKNKLWDDDELNAQINLQLDLVTLAGFSPLFQARMEQVQIAFQHGDIKRYDRLTTDTFLLYLSYVAAAEKSGKAWFFTTSLTEPLTRPSATEVDLFVKAFESGEVSEYLSRFASPMLNQPGFERVYIDLLSRAQLPTTIYEQYGLVRLGDRLEPQQYQLLLEKLTEAGIAVEYRDDGYIDEALDFSIRQFQVQYGLDDDGIIGPNTVEWLNKAAEDKLRILALNSERSRLWPQQRENIILVNVPNFQLEYWDEGYARFESRVIVGRTSRQTPLLETQMDSLILNPTWNVPWKIMVKDIIPKVKQDPTYLFSQRFDIIEGWDSKVKIDPTMINWRAVKAQQFPYRMRQQAGELNALGQYKFNTPNPQAIFLHDTPSKHLFDESLRAFSSGCIRVENADEFAEVLLEQQGKSLEEVATERPNKSVAFKQRIPVYIIYQTAWMSEGKAYFRGDIYDYDTKRDSLISGEFSKN